MSQIFNPIFAFNRLFGEESANSIITRLICHPVIWELFSKEYYFLRVVDLFGDVIEKWTPENICLGTGEIKEQDVNSIGQAIDGDKQTDYDQLIEIFGLVKKVKDLKRTQKSWSEVFDKLEFNKLREDEILRKWGTVFTISVNSDLEEKELADSLVRNNKNKINLLSFIINCASNKNKTNDFIDRNINYFVDDPGLLKELIFKLDKIGAHSEAKEIVLFFLHYIDILFSNNENEKSLFLNRSEIEELNLLNELCTLSLYVDDKVKYRLYKDLSEEAYRKLPNNHPISPYILDYGVDNDDFFSLDSFLSIPKNQNDLHYSFNNKNLKSLYQAFYLSFSNRSAAKLLCQRFINKMEKLGFEKILFSPEIGYFIDPIDIAKLFLKVGLEHNAVSFLEKILKTHPRNYQIIRFIAYYSWSLGDHRRAVKYYSVLYGEKNISREEKILFSESLEYLEMWSEAFIVQETINIINITDRFERSSLALKADKNAEFNREIEEIFLKSPNNQTAQAMKALFLQKNNQKSLADSIITSLISKSLKDIRTIKIIEEYLRKNKDVSKVMQFLEGLPPKVQKIPEITLLIAKTRKEFGKIHEFEKVLHSLSKISGNINQKILEEILFELFDHEMYSDAEVLLQTYKDKWKLSPEIIQAKINIYLETGDFEKAGEIISSLKTDNPITEKLVIAYGCFLLKTSITEFPYSRHITKIIEQDKNKFHKIASRLDNMESSLFVKLLRIEIESTEKEKDYKKVLSENSFSSSNSNWRIAFGLGNLNFRNNNFDQAITYLKETLKLKPSHPIILDLLIESYSRLQLHIEAINLINQQIKEKNLSLGKLLKYSDYLFEHQEFISLLDAAIKDKKSQYIFLFAKAKSLIKQKRFQEAGKYLVEIEQAKNLELDNLLIIAQFYIDCGDITSTKRIMGIYLSQKEDLLKNNILESASIFYQIKDYKKALNLVNQINNRNAYLSFIKIDILKQDNEFDQAREVVDEAIRSIEENRIIKIQFDNCKVSIPVEWKRDIPGHYLSLMLLIIKKEQLNNVFELAKKGIYYFPLNCSLNELTLKLAHILGDNKYVSEFFEKISENENVNYKREILIEAENALNIGEEVTAARILSNVENNEEKNIHIEAIQARLLSRNNNLADANLIYQKILGRIQSIGFSNEENSSEKINKLIDLHAICETAFELDDLETTLEISRNIIANFGFTLRIGINFIRALTKMLERNRINHKLLIKNHNFRVLENDINVFEEIVRDNELMLTDIQEWIDRCKAVLYDDKKNHEKVIKLPVDNENIGAILYSLLSLEKKFEADHVLALNEDNNESLFIYAVLKKDSEPEKAKKIILQLLQKGEPKPEYYMALSDINEQLGQLTDSYSSICLALDRWPDEYGWENFAGNLCKKIGNIRAAYTHFRNAEKFDPKTKYSDQIVNFSLKSDWLPSIKELEKQLTNTSKDFQILIKIADKLIEIDRINDANYFIKKANSIQFDNDEIKIILAKIAYKKYDFEISLEIIEKVLQNNQFSVEAIRLKARLINELESVDHAISYLDSFYNNDLVEDKALVIQKAEFIRQKNGVELAIEYVISKHDILENTRLLIYLAKLYKINGDMNNALYYAEEALGNDPENIELLKFLGEVSKDLGDLDKAIDYIYRSLTLNPFDKENYISLSQLFENRRDNERAIDILMEGLDIAPDDYYLLRYTGILLFKQGRYKKANDIIWKALRKDPSDSELIQIKRILENTMQINMNQIGVTEV